MGYVEDVPMYMYVNGRDVDEAEFYKELKSCEGKELTKVEEADSCTIKFEVGGKTFTILAGQVHPY